MKIHLLSLFFLITAILTAQQEEFYVLHVDGKITYGKNKVLLKQGAILKDDISFNFSSPLDKAKLVGSKSGYWYLHPKEQSEENSSLFGFSFLENIQPEQEFAASRGDENALSYLFFENGNLVAPKKIKVFFVPKDTASYYFFQFKHNDSTIRRKLLLDTNKKIEVNDAVLRFEKENIQLADLSYGNIGFYDANTDTDRMLNGVSYAFVDKNAVRDQLLYLKTIFQKQDEAPGATTEKLKTYLKNTYGNAIALQNLKLHSDE